MGLTDSGARSEGTRHSSAGGVQARSVAPPRRIASIATTVGYGNLSNFNRQFLRAYGMTPRDLRRAVAGGTSVSTEIE